MSALNFLIAVLPLLALVGALIAGRYPGEAAIGRLKVLFEALRVRYAAVRAPCTGPVFLPAVRGGDLISRSLAGRAPPASS